MKHRIILLICLVTFSWMTASGGNRKANRYFELFQYSKAIPLYKKSATKGKGEEQKEATFRLADCYRLTNDVKEARSWYAKALEMGEGEPVNHYYLGQVLRTLGEYEEAETQFLKYAELEPGDPRGEIYAGYCREVREWQPLDPSVEIKNVASLNSRYSDFAPVFYQDGLLFSSDRSSGSPEDYVYEWTNFGYLDLYFAKPAYFNDFWSEMAMPARMADVLNQTWHDGPVSFSSDLKTVSLTRTTRNKLKKDEQNIKTSLLKIFMGDISSDNRIKFTPFPHNSDTYSVGHATLSADGNKVIFASDMPGGFGGTDLYISDKTGGTWSAPRNLGPSVNTIGNEVFPFWYNDTTLYFASDGLPGYGGLDLYESEWNGEEWASPENMGEPVNSSWDDFGLVFRAEKKDGFFSSNRPGGLGADDIYALRNYSQKRVEKEEKPKTPEKGEWLATGMTLCGYVKDKVTMQPLEDASVFVLDSHSGQVIVLKTDREGYFCFEADSGALYLAKAMKPGYFDDCLNYRFSGADSDQPARLPRALLLDKLELNRSFVVENIYYDLDKWNIRADAKPALDHVVRIMKEYPIAIELSSHTDSRASHAYNDELSQKRAEAAVRYITLKGVNPVRMIAQGYGETQLVNRCADGVPCSEAEHQENRRTEIKILDVQSEYYWKKPFDPSVFKANEVIPVQMLDPDFFKGCLLPQDENELLSEKREQAVSPSGTLLTVSGVTDTENSKPVAASVVETEATTNPVKVASGIDQSQISVDGTFYSVQILASITSIEPDSREFKGQGGVFEKKIGRYYKYFIGTFTSDEEALMKKRELEGSFPGCFVVGFKDGQSFPLAN